MPKVHTTDYALPADKILLSQNNLLILRAKALVKHFFMLSIQVQNFAHGELYHGSEAFKIDLSSFPLADKRDSFALVSVLTVDVFDTLKNFATRIYSYCNISENFDTLIFAKVHTARASILKNLQYKKLFEIKQNAGLGLQVYKPKFLFLIKRYIVTSLTRRKSFQLRRTVNKFLSIMWLVVSNLLFGPL